MRNRITLLLLVVSLLSFPLFGESRRRAACPAGRCEPVVPATTFSLGDVSLTPDTARAAQVVAKPGAASTLTATAADGTVWTLTIPAGALIATRTITMTPLAAVMPSGGATIAPRGGVLLEPDGLQFAIPATLSASPAQQIVTTRHDGSNAQIAVPSGQDLSSVDLFHFSAAVSTAPMTREQAAAARTALLQDARNYLAQQQGMPNTYPHPVPDLPRDQCQTDDAARGQIQDEYRQQITTPELDIVIDIIAAARTEALLGGADAMGPDEVSVITKLEQRILDRTMQAMQDARKEPKHGVWKADTLIATALGTMRDMAMLGAGGDLQSSGFGPFVAEWLNDILDDQFDALKKDHDFTVTPFILGLARQIALLGGQIDDSTLQRLADAYRFTIHVDMDASFSGGVQTLHLAASGDGTLKADALGNIAGDAHVSYTDGRGSSQNSLGQVTLQLMSTGFDTHVIVERFDPCNGDAAFAFSTLNSTPETWNVCDPKGCDNSDLSEHDMFALGFDDEREAEGYVLDYNLMNKQAVPVDGTRNVTQFANGGTGTAKVHVTLTHTPR